MRDYDSVGKYVSVQHLSCFSFIDFSSATVEPSSLAKVPIRFTPLPLGGFRQVNMRLTSFASYMLVVG